MERSFQLFWLSTSIWARTPSFSSAVSFVHIASTLDKGTAAAFGLLGVVVAVEYEPATCDGLAAVARQRMGARWRARRRADCIVEMEMVVFGIWREEFVLSDSGAEREFCWPIRKSHFRTNSIPASSRPQGRGLMQSLPQRPINGSGPT